MLTVEQRHLLILEFESAQTAARGFARGWQDLAEHPLDAAFRLHVEDVDASRGFYDLLNSFTDWGQHVLVSSEDQRLGARPITSTGVAPK